MSNVTIKNNLHETVTFAGGCFWCTEAVFQKLKGVTSVIPGYTGGKIPNPTYEQVCTGTTGHAEAIQIIFDPNLIPFRKLVEVFFHLHDPTTLNRQGNDTGTQYRSAIFYSSETQKKNAQEVKADIGQQKLYPGKVVTEIVPFTKFYKAENYHQDYYNKNSYQPYCQYVIDPKIQKLKKEFAAEVK